MYGRGYSGITGCHSDDGCFLYYGSSRGSSSGDGGGESTGGSTSLATGGDSCPPQGTEVLPNDAGLSLFLVEGAAVIYACSNGVVIGRCVFRSGPAPPPTIGVSIVCVSGGSSLLLSVV